MTGRTGGGGEQDNVCAGIELQIANVDGGTARKDNGTSDGRDQLSHIARPLIAANCSKRGRRKGTSKNPLFRRDMTSVEWMVWF